MQKVAPAIAAGNAIVAKPYPAGTRTALKLAELFQAAGWPKGLFTVLTGDKASAAALVSHKDVRAVSFTGGTAGGDALARIAGAKKFVAELGSNAANIVMSDADIADAAKKIAGAAFEASGQQCISAQRVLVETAVMPKFLEAFVAAAKALKVGAASDPATDVGPMVSAAAADRVMAMPAEDAVQRGARYALKPQREGATVSPGILVQVPQAARLWCDEVFGSIAVVAAVRWDRGRPGLANEARSACRSPVHVEPQGGIPLVGRFRCQLAWVDEPAGRSPGRCVSLRRREIVGRGSRGHSLRHRGAEPGQVRRHQAVSGRV